MNTDPIPPSACQPVSIIRARYDSATATKALERMRGPHCGEFVPLAGYLAIEQRRYVSEKGRGVIATIRPFDTPLPGRAPHWGTIPPQEAEWVVSACSFLGAPIDLEEAFGGATHPIPEVVKGAPPEDFSPDFWGTCYVTQGDLDEFVAALLTGATVGEEA